MGKLRYDLNPGFKCSIFQGSAKGHPKITGSLSSYASESPLGEFKEDLKALFRNRNYKILFLGVALILSDAIVMFVFLPWVSKFYEYEN